MQEQNDKELLAAAYRDPEAFALLYRRHLDWVVAFFMARTGDRELAADLSSEVFAVVLKRGMRRYLVRTSVKAWIAGVARKIYADSVRKGQAERRARERLGIPQKEISAEDLLLVERLAQNGGHELDSTLLDGLPDDQRQAVISRVVDESDYREIATTMDTSEATARKRVSRGLAQLRSNMEER